MWQRSCDFSNDVIADPYRDERNFRKRLRKSSSSLWGSVYSNKRWRSAKSDEGCIEGVVRRLSLMGGRLRVQKNSYVGRLTYQCRPTRPLIASFCACQAGWHSGSAVDCGDVFKRYTICISARVQAYTLFRRIYGWNSYFK